jgi:hypothetical protein
MTPPAGGKGGTRKAGLKAGDTGEGETKLKGEVVRFTAKGVDTNRGENTGQAGAGDNNMIKTAGLSARPSLEGGVGMKIARDAASEETSISDRAEVQEFATVSSDHIICAATGRGENGGHKRG